MVKVLDNGNYVVRSPNWDMGQLLMPGQWYVRGVWFCKQF
ncbi:hypothetical protein [Dyadobacter frigoris]